MENPSKFILYFDFVIEEEYEKIEEKK